MRGAKHKLQVKENETRKLSKHKIFFSVREESKPITNKLLSNVIFPKILDYVVLKHNRGGSKALGSITKFCPFKSVCTTKPIN